MLLRMTLSQHCRTQKFHTRFFFFIICNRESINRSNLTNKEKQISQLSPRQFPSFLSILCQDETSTWSENLRTYLLQSPSHRMTSTWILTTSRLFVLNNILDTISWVCSFPSLVGSAYSKHCNFNFSFSFLESNSSFIKLRFPIKASLTLLLLGHLVIEIDFQNFFVSKTSQALFIAINLFNWLMLNSLKYSIVA